MDYDGRRQRSSRGVKYLQRLLLCCDRGLIFLHILSVGGDQFVAHGDNIGDVKLGGGMGVHHGYLIDGAAVPAAGCLDGEKLDRNIA